MFVGEKSDSIRYGKDGREYFFLGIEIFGWLPMLAGLAMAELGNTSRKLYIARKIQTKVCKKPTRRTSYQ
jgi:hypothetical protein